MVEFVLSNARIILPDGPVLGSLAVRDGLIAAIDDRPSGLPGARDLEGDLLIPGLVECHTDNLEHHLQPRPNVQWPSARAALLAHDAQVATAGITTVLDAMALGDFGNDGRRRQMLHRAVAAVTDPVSRPLTRAEHFVHLRCELTDEAVVDIFRSVADTPLVRLVSFMDHTPGHRQWSSLETYRSFNRGKGWTDAEFAAHVAERQSEQQRLVERNLGELLDLVRTRPVVLASHDDTDPAHVDFAVRHGMHVSEFPTTRAAAERARAAGLFIVMGAPNVVRGESHSGNVSALDLAGSGLVDALSSDYAPTSLLHAAFTLHRKAGLSLERAIGLVTDHPARLLGLNDRGRLAPGLRADLLRVRIVEDLPVVTTVWRAGERVA